LNKQEFFDRLAASWDEEERPDIYERLARVVSLSCLRGGHTVLDVGTGTGVLIPHILRAVGERGVVVAIDISREMLRQARQKGFPPNVHLILADMQRAGFQPLVFDRVLCNAVFPHFDDKERALYEAWRVLRPGGLLVISHPIGREAVNRLHAQCRAVAEDRVPAAARMYELLTRLGWSDVKVIDEPEFYLARARKRELP
jgi:ubiquinone/menaquinone biosynthesis C-methylase UbiE